MHLSLCERGRGEGGLHVGAGGSGDKGFLRTKVLASLWRGVGRGGPGTSLTLTCQALGIGKALFILQLKMYINVYINQNEFKINSRKEVNPIAGAVSLEK